MDQENKFRLLNIYYNRARQAIFTGLIGETKAQGAAESIPFPILMEPRPVGKHFQPEQLHLAKYQQIFTITAYLVRILLYYVRITALSICIIQIKCVNLCEKIIAKFAILSKLDTNMSEISNGEGRHCTIQRQIF